MRVAKIPAKTLFRHKLPMVAAFFCICQISLWADRNDRDEAVLFCSADADFHDLLARAGQLDLEGKHADALQLQQNLLSIRPNCYDIHLSIGMTYAILNNEEKSRYHYTRYEQLKRSYDDSRPHKPEAKIPPRTKAKTVVLQAPPKKEKINYWKWLYIYSILRKK